MRHSKSQVFLEFNPPKALGFAFLYTEKLTPGQSADYYDISPRQNGGCMKTACIFLWLTCTPPQLPPANELLSMRPMPRITLFEPSFIFIHHRIVHRRIPIASVGSSVFGKRGRYRYVYEAKNLLPRTIELEWNLTLGRYSKTKRIWTVRIRPRQTQRLEFFDERGPSMNFSARLRIKDAKGRVLFNDLRHAWVPQ